MLKYLKWFFSMFVFYADDPNAGGAGGGGGGDGGGDAGGKGGGAGDAGTGDGANKGADPNAGKGADPNAGEIKFPEKWRDGLAAGDTKKIERLSRYGTPQAVADALLSVQERISKGELRSNVPYPEKGTDAEKSEWRKEQGIPAEPAAYYSELKLAEGRAVSDEDKPRMDGFIAKLHSRNASPSVVSAAIDAYYDEVESRTQERLELDKQQVQATRDNLIASGGLQEFKTNQTLIDGMLEMMPEKVRDLFKHGRLADGSPIYGGNIEVFQGLAAMARAINPVAAIVPNSGDNTAGAIDDEIGKIEKTMRTDRASYNKDVKMQERYQQLLGARERAKGQKT